MKLYKYLKKQYLKNWYDDGAIFFSPLERFIKMESSNICSDKYEGINISIDARKVTFYLDGQSFEAILSGNIYARNPNIASSLPYICSFSVDYNAELCERLKAEVVLEFDFDESLHESFNDLGIAHQNVEYLHIFQVSENIFIKRPIFLRRTRVSSCIQTSICKKARIYTIAKR